MSSSSNNKIDNKSLLILLFSILFVNQNVYSQQENLQSEIDKKKVDLLELGQFLSYLDNIGTIGDACNLTITENKNNEEFMKLCFDFVRSVNKHMKVVFQENSELISKILD